MQLASVLPWLRLKTVVHLFRAVLMSDILISCLSLPLPVCSGQTPASAPCQRSQTGSVVCSPDSTNLVENGDSTPSDGPKDELGSKMATDLSELASTLLDSWGSLKVHVCYHFVV